MRVLCQKTLVILAIYLVPMMLMAQDSLTVLVWNIHKESDATMQANLKVLAVDADFVLFQEAYFSSEYYANLQALDMPYWSEATSFHMPSREGWVGTGVATGAKWPSLDSHSLETETVEYLLGTTKQSLMTTYQLNGDQFSLLVINTHAINFVTTEEFDHEMRRLAAVIEEHRGPIIWAGDFNTWNQNRLEHLSLAVQDLGLERVPFVNGSRKTFNGYPLDHVFYRGLQLKKIIPFERVSSSDHLPLKVTFSIK